MSRLGVLTGGAYFARRRIAAYFAAQHAITAPEAIGYVPRTRWEKEAFADLRARGIVREATSGAYFMLLPAYDAYEDARRRWLVPRVIGLAVLLSVLVMLFYRSGAVPPPGSGLR